MAVRDAGEEEEEDVIYKEKEKEKEKQNEEAMKQIITKLAEVAEESGSDEYSSYS